MNWWVGVAFGVTVLVSGVVAAVLWRWMCNAEDELIAKLDEVKADRDRALDRTERYELRVAFLERHVKNRRDELAAARERIKALEDTVRRMGQNAGAIQASARQSLGGSLADSGLTCKGGNGDE